MDRAMDTNLPLPLDRAAAEGGPHGLLRAVGETAREGIGAGAARGREEGAPLFDILAIDPGPTESGWCRFKDGRVIGSGVMQNDKMRDEIRYGTNATLAIEMIASYGMAVGRDVFETCVQIGRFVECFSRPADVQLVYRKDVKLHLCGTAKAKDPNIRAALLDLIGPQGTKKEPGPTYGVKTHAWAALAVAVTAAQTRIAA
ncbi:MAG: hypothetical protein NDI84_15205 [Steroidobacteraceae bacterium]|nr:hypothetical protein [Steroidobacteraceae bacterium]